MPLDGIFLHLLIKELNDTLIGSRVEKVHQPTKDELVFYLRSRSGANKLLISSNANSSRMHITQNPPENPRNPSMLCMLFRKHLTSAIVKGFRQNELDRVVFIDFDATNEIGDRVKLSLCVEIMSKHSNMILIREDNTIVGAVKRIDFTKSSARQVLPNIEYKLPPSQGKLNILEKPTSLIIETLDKHRDIDFSSAVLATIQGVSPLISRELAERCKIDVKVNSFTENECQRIGKTLEELKDTVKNLSGTPIMLKNANGLPKEFSYMDITQYGFTLASLKFETYSELLEEFYFERDRIERTRQRAADILKVLNNASARIIKKLEIQRSELKKSINREELRIKAELINANQHNLQRGSSFYVLENYYDNNEVIRISADPVLTPAMNSQKYYKEYRKAKNAEKMLSGLIEQGEQELIYIDSVIDALSRTTTQQEIVEIRGELEHEGVLRRHKKNKNKKQKPLEPIEYESVDGFKILVGRNNIQNDKLSLKIANKNDLWLHTQKISGSHVVVVSENREIPETTIEQAAEIAAFHSRASNSSNVPVDYTFVKQLKKPVGAKPGKVIYHVYSTIIVEPKDHSK
ncbi:MAG TPA: NFACT RNA binding domain-containing protein [Clostridia bacterium]|nr:NFACT RNA binding domain-containing protein [Clostridia bacterium]